MPQVEISVDDFLSDCDSWDRAELIKALVEDGYIKHSQVIKDGVSNTSCSEDKFEEALDVLHGKWNMLSTAEEEQILSIAKRF